VFKRAAHSFPIHAQTKPDKGISIIECDLNVDFAPPVGYVEPQARPPPSASPVWGLPACLFSTLSVLVDLQPSGLLRTGSMAVAWFAQNEDASSMKSAVSKKEPKGFVPFGGSGNRLGVFPSF
jgi:ubiquitin fusion degradation protein 1